MAGDLKQAKLLLAHSASVDPVYDSDGTTPLLLAVKGRHWAVAEVLLKAGANANIQDPNKRTSLHWALKNGAEPKHVETLFKYGASGDIEDGDRRTAEAIMRRKRDPAFGKMADRFLA